MADTQGSLGGGPTGGPGPTDVGVSSVTTDSARRDVRYEVLDMNSQGMYMCQTQQLDEAEALLTQAYNVLETDNTINDAQSLDQLRSTTLNNLGVVECHKGLHKQALNHLEVAQTLEQQWDVHSPSVSLNICAACNALGLYDRATTAALDTIEMLRQSAKGGLNETTTGSAGGGLETTAGTGKDGTASGAASGGAVDAGDNNVLWGAAWHNLAVAQLNSASGKDLSEYTNVLAVFHNAMKATSELLGWEHPMTRAVHETYRGARQHLREAGAYKQHHALLTAEMPPISGRRPLPEPEGGMTTSATARKQDKDLHLTVRGKDTGGKKVVERYSGEAFPSASGGGISPRQRGTGRLKAISPRGTPRQHAALEGSGTQQGQRQQTSPLRGIPLSGNLLAASTLYRNPHPLLLHPKPRPVEYIPRAPPMDSARSTANKNPMADVLPPLDNTVKGSTTGSSKPREQLSEDMWVEAVTNPSPGKKHAAASGTGSNPRAARPVYSQQLYALDGMGNDQHRVTQPVQTAHVMADSKTK